jgi:hypothetical protein
MLLSSMSKRTPTAERVRKLLHYDPATGAFTWLFQTYRNSDRPLNRPKKAGSLDRFGYWRISIDGLAYTASNIAWLYMTGEWPGEWPSCQVDHKNRNTADDSWNNLRLATRTENNANSRVFKNNKLGIKGVRLHANGCYVAAICVGGQRQHLGCYKTAEEAKAVYDAAATKLFGEFARLT